MYNLADKSYMRQPALMSPDVVSATFLKIRAHALKHKVSSVHFVFHGGEPMLAGPEFFQSFVTTCRNIMAPDVVPTFGMQTNGTLLTKEWLELFLSLGIKFGISIDGTAEAHNTNRVDHQGRGSYDRVAAAIQLVGSDERFSELSGSALTVIELTSNPLEVYRHLKSLGLKSIDFLLPNGTYDAPPPGITSVTKPGDARVTSYADWLIPIFDEWFENEEAIEIRLFQNIIALIFGSQHSKSDLGGRVNRYLVIETDGGIEPVDSLKACGEDFTKVGLNVLANEIDDAYEIPLFKQYLSGAQALCQTCQKCPIVDVCGGGYIPHRFSSDNLFDNPSIYCADLMKLINHIQERTLASLPGDLRSQLKLATLAEVEAAAAMIAP
jgi:Arylsulfatase regulator (Fe-S oxidoreductase)